MSPDLSDLLKKALALPQDERAALANTLLDSLDSVQATEQAWDDEIARRMKNLTWEQLHRELLAMVNGA